MKALEYVKALYENFIPGTASWNDSSNNKIFVAGDLHLTSNGISIYVAAQKENKAVADDMNHAYMPVGPVGKPTELHLAFPILTFNFTKAPQACKALTAFMLEAENFNPWIEAAQGYLSHFLLDYDKNPVWTADPKRTPYRDVSKRTLTPGGHGLARREGGGGDRRLHRGRHVRELRNRPRGRQGRDRGGRAAGASASIAETEYVAGGRFRDRPPAHSLHSRWSELTAWSTPRYPRDARRSPSHRRGAGCKANRHWLGYWFMLPALAILVLFLAYPLGLGVWLSFTDAKIGRAGEFIGLENYEWLQGDSIFWISVFNTLLYTIVASVIKFGAGLYLALLLNKHLPFKAMIRAAILIPFIVPTVLSAIAFWWIYDTQFSIISWSLKQARADHDQHRLPRRPEQCARVDDLRQHLARRAVRRDHAARRPADRVALALRGGDARRRDALADASATSPIRC